jgi:hypothetical protein
MRLARGFGVAVHTVTANGSALRLREGKGREYPGGASRRQQQAQPLEVLRLRVGRAGSSAEETRPSHGGSADGRALRQSVPEFAGQSRVVNVAVRFHVVVDVEGTFEMHRQSSRRHAVRRAR